MESLKALLPKLQPMAPKPAMPAAPAQAEAAPSGAIAQDQARFGGLETGDDAVSAGPNPWEQPFDLEGLQQKVGLLHSEQLQNMQDGGFLQQKDRSGLSPAAVLGQLSNLSAPLKGLKDTIATFHRAFEENPDVIQAQGKDLCVSALVVGGWSPEAQADAVSQIENADPTPGPGESYTIQVEGEGEFTLSAENKAAVDAAYPGPENQAAREQAYLQVAVQETSLPGYTFANDAKITRSDRGVGIVDEENPGQIITDVQSRGLTWDQTKGALSPVYDPASGGSIDQAVADNPDGVYVPMQKVDEGGKPVEPAVYHMVRMTPGPDGETQIYDPASGETGSMSDVNGWAVPTGEIPADAEIGEDEAWFFSSDEV